jgi:hypothetical protein
LAGFVVDQIDDSVVALTYAVPIRVAGEFFGATRPRIRSQSLDPNDYPLAIGLRAYGLELLPRGRLDRKAI